MTTQDVQQSLPMNTGHPCTWKRDPSLGPPYLSWCLIVRNSERTLEACLRSIRERTPNAEIVVVDTMSSDRSPEIAQRYADVWVEWTGPRGDWTREMPWFDDAAAARNHAFQLASGRFRAWIDADDRLPPPEEAERLLKINNRWHPAPRNAHVHNGDNAPVGLEDLLRRLEEVDPQADCVWAPYLYRRDEHGQAITWQERERIVKWTDPPRWRWAEAAHEILVPVTGHVPRLHSFSGLLFVHEKDFSNEAVLENITRHFGILLKQYEQGERTTRRCLYLAELCRTIMPERELEFLAAAEEVSTIPLDRFRVHLQRGIYWATRGLFADALASWGAAVQMRPDLPDAWLAGGEWWARAKDPAKAVEWLTRGLALPLNGVESYITPRQAAVYYPTLLANQLGELGRALVQVGRNEEAVRVFNEAAMRMLSVRESDAVGQDKAEAQALLLRAHDAQRAQQQAMAIADLAKYLLDSDEPLKVEHLLQAAPWSLRDHPLIVETERQLRPVREHVTNPTAYSDFYHSEKDTGFMPSPEEHLDLETAVPRARWIAEWLQKRCPNARVVDIGCFDGIVGIPLLRACPDITYLGVDPYDGAVRGFQDRLERFGLAGRARVVQSDDLECVEPGSADVLIWTEVIEHVPDPRAEVAKLGRLLKEGGLLFITTPWGAFDKGSPRPTTSHGTPRGSRGHLRAMVPRDVVAVFDGGWWEIEDLHFEAAAPGYLGDELNAVVRKAPPMAAPPVHFAVAGALWDWNSRIVEAEGMGASEGMIVHLADALAKGTRVDVYGPTPRPDIYKGVRYWPREHMRHIKSGAIVVSRAPSYYKLIDDAIGTCLPKLLWLQDAWYPDLNEETARAYEKVVVVSEWHKLAMHARHGVPLDKMEVLYNFVVPERFPSLWPERKRDHFVYCSSPDRGLVRLLELWPRIRQALPEATLDIFYGWRGCERLGSGMNPAWNVRYERARKRFEELKHQPGVQVLGMVNEATLIAVLQKTGVWAYPSGDKINGIFEETCCANAIMARAAGAVPVCPPIAALAETAACDQGFFVDFADDDGFVSACVEASQVSDEDRHAMSTVAFERFGLDAFLPRWREILR